MLRFQYLARLLGVNRSTVYRWLNDERVHPSNEKTEKILSAARSMHPDLVKGILVGELISFTRLVRSELMEVQR